MLRWKKEDLKQNLEFDGFGVMVYRFKGFIIGKRVKGERKKKIKPKLE